MALFILMADSVPSECASMPLHHRVVLAAHDGSLGAVRVIRVQKGRVTIETITELNDREGETESRISK